MNVVEVRRLPLSDTALWVGLYVAAGVVSGQFNVPTAALAPYVWLPAGVSLAAMLLSRTSASGRLAVAFALVQAVLSHFGGRDVPSSLVLGALAGIAPLIASAVVRWMHVPLQGLDLLRAVTVAAVVSAVLLGGGGAFYFALTKGMPFMLPFREWSAAIFVGVCITMPLLAVWAQFRPKRSAPSNWQREMVGAIAFATMVALTWWLFDGAATPRFEAAAITYPIYLPMFCVVIVSIVGGARGGTLAVFVLTLICLGHTAGGEGPFALPSASASSSLLQAQLYVGVSAMLVLIVHALRDAETHAYLQAERWRTELELALAGSVLIAYSIDPRTQIVQWRGDVERLLGYPTESLSNVERVLACVHPLDRDRLRDRWSPHALVTTDAPAPISFRLATRIANVGWIELVDLGSSLSDGNGRVAFVAGVWQRHSIVAS
ncbi:MASE1 domain-containing protein [Paraburkholderia sp. BCC1876]|uniref:MASE1 domain-containing protein n=1 Tax=Paraburkholderia sp. BCC1876 TaxID=2676303 RepID=UPI0015902E54|nr:MASE1 domain-containing protein [Paraburkholderia sp. BCC1876]